MIGIAGRPALLTIPKANVYKKGDMSDLPLKNSKMTYESYKTGMLRVFVVLSIPLVLVTYFEYDLSLTNKFFYSLGILFQTLVIFGCIYLFSLLIIKPFIK